MDLDELRLTRGKGVGTEGPRVWVYLLDYLARSTRGDDKIDTGGEVGIIRLARQI